MNALLAFLSHDWSGLAIAALVGAAGYGLLRLARRRGATWLKFLSSSLLGSAALLGAGAGYHLYYVARVWQQHPPPGKLVDVGGYRMHVLAEGEARGRPAIVWMPGAHSGSFAFYHLHAAMRSEARSILVDRPGSGWSDAGPFPRTTPREVAEVVKALSAAGEKGPFIFAGHSFGGLLVANIARRHPELTAAVVLIDATPPDAINLAPPNPFIDDMFRQATLGTLAMAFGIHSSVLQRMRGEEVPAAFKRVTEIIERELGDAGRTMRKIEDSPRVMAANRSSFEELRRGGLGWDETVYDGDLENQLVYLVAPPRMAEFQTVAKEMVSAEGQADPAQREARRLMRFYSITRERYMQTSTRAVRVFAPDGSSHNFPYEHPQFMVDTLRRVLADVDNPSATPTVAPAIEVPTTPAAAPAAGPAPPKS